MAAAEEPGAAPATGSSSKAGEGEPAASFQSRLWRSLQLGSKGKGSGKAGAERRSADTSPSLPRSRAIEQPAKADLLAGGDGVVGVARWGGLRRRKHVLDRVFSSSQPNLCCSSAEPLEAVSAEAGSSLRRLREHLLHHPQGKGGQPQQQHGRGPDHPPASPSSASSAAAPEKDRVVGGDGALKAEAREEPPQPPRLGAHLSHQKSSSLPGNTACLEQLLQDSPAKGKAKGPEGSASPAGSPRSSKLLQAGALRNMMEIHVAGYETPLKNLARFVWLPLLVKGPGWKRLGNLHQSNSEFLDYDCVCIHKTSTEERK
ncbi:multiple C2 and transmembrane domain-containing protein 1-like [Ahaetulla prasina]|uniref:multiple C2 and transmembrane domain-containing protein 1-like n=1 Tax=Ahaetulla prasina TaxID=499056 RepID=UPI00264810FA|nr:multiple C2 and transmembrane domain-containing protein 1-like [Ahaetulla prasina]